MKTSITQSYLDTYAGQEANRILRNCVHCGFCNATCPTYQLLGDELDGPRGRIYLIKQVLEGNQPGDKTLLHLDRCLTCRNCETTCPSGVDYSRLLETGRQLVEKSVKRPITQRLFRSALAKLLLNRKLFGFLLSCGQGFKKLLPNFLSKNIPQRGSDILDWPVKSHERKILLVEGCVQPSLQPDTDRAAAVVLDRINIQALRTKATCCGAINHHMNAEALALARIKQNIDSWWPMISAGTVEAITMTASGCGVMIKDYAQILFDDAEYRDKAEAISAHYKDMSEILSNAGFAPSANLEHSRIAFHPPCTLQHGMKLNGLIEPILESAGYELVPFQDTHLCCGSAGTYSLTQKSISQRLRNNKLAAIEAGTPEVIVTANVGCQTHLQSGTQLPVKHWLELLV